MKQRSSFSLYNFRRELLARTVAFALILLSFTFPLKIQAQCPTGATTANLNWDYRNYLVTTGNYTGYVTAAMSTSQNFSFGTNRINISMGGSVTTVGQNTTVTAVTGSYASGASVNYNGNGTVTFTFDTVVANLNFSLLDIDNGQSAAVTANDASGIPLNITMSSVATGILTVTGSGTVTPLAVSSLTNCTSTGTDYRGIVNVSIGGFSPAGTNGVKTVTITTGLVSGDFWLSDLSACVYKSFPTNYYKISKPWTGQPAYTIANSNASTASLLNLSTGNARFIFQDGGTGSNPWINSFGYDPYNYKLYYTYDSSGATSNVSYSTKAKYKAVKKYDFNTITTTMGSGTISTLIPDVTVAPFNIPVFDQGLVSGGAAFNGGSLYLGVEGTNADVKIGGKYSVSGRYSMIWRIDFDASGNATQACQVYAMLADDGNQHITHDWGDFSIVDGVLYDFNSAGSTSSTSYNKFYNYDLQTGTITATFSPNGNPVPGQSAVDWNNNIYWLSSSQDKLATYAPATGTISATTAITGASSLDWTSAGAGEASEAFKPPIDYGDAPASYDPSTVDPASHDYDSTIRLGNSWTAEFAEKASSNATGDGASDDGIGAAPALLNFGGTVTYSVTVNVYNHTGSNAILAGWLDYNFNGVFDPGEGVTVTVPTGTTLQSKTLTWTSIVVPASALTQTFLRLRVTRSANGLAITDMNGYKPDGEVEDYSVVLGINLPVDFSSFSATKITQTTTGVNWSVSGDLNKLSHFEIERSANGQDWSTIASVNNSSIINYSYEDKELPAGKFFYRIKLLSVDGSYKYSESKSVYFDGITSSVAVFPNPAKEKVIVRFNATTQSNATISIIDYSGRAVMTQNFITIPGDNQVNLEKLGNFANGIYILKLDAGPSTTNIKLVIKKD